MRCGCDQFVLDKRHKKRSLGEQRERYPLHQKYGQSSTSMKVVPLVSERINPAAPSYNLGPPGKNILHLRLRVAIRIRTDQTSPRFPKKGLQVRRMPA